MKMTHRERFLYERWKARRATKERAKQLARKARRIDPSAKPTPGFWPGMYEGVPRPVVAKPIFYQERAIQSVGFLKGVSKFTGPPQQSVRKSARVAPSNPSSLTQDLSGGAHGRKAGMTPSSERPQITENICDRETQKLCAVLSDPKVVGQDA